MAVRGSLVDDGCCVVEGVVDAALLDEVRAAAGQALAVVSAEHRQRNRSQGSLINLADHPRFAGLIGSPALGQVFRRLGFADPRFGSGYLISKPPGGPPLFWHQDWWGWDDPMSYTDRVVQVFFMVYLTDTTPANGCLRVIPGSHRRRHRLHDAVAAHDDELSRVVRPDDPIYASIKGEVAVPVRAGDVVVGDARLLHSAYANRSAAERSLITLWYYPDYRSLPAGMRARIREIFERRGVDTDPAAAGSLTPEGWPAPARALVQPLFPPPAPGAVPHAWNRVPDARLQRGGTASGALQMSPSRRSHE